MSKTYPISFNIFVSAQCIKLGGVGHKVPLMDTTYTFSTEYKLYHPCLVLHHTNKTYINMAHEHHKEAAYHFGEAAKHHQKAQQLHESGEHEQEAHEAYQAQGHHNLADKHAKAAAEHHAEGHDKEHSDPIA